MKTNLAGFGVNSGVLTARMFIGDFFSFNATCCVLLLVQLSAFLSLFFHISLHGIQSCLLRRGFLCLSQVVSKCPDFGGVETETTVDFRSLKRLL